MSDINNRLRRALAETHRPVDEDFARRVRDRIEVHERMRVVRLAILTLAALCLAGVLFQGLFLSWALPRDTSVAIAKLMWTIMPMFAVALLSVTFVARWRRHLRE